MISFCIITDNRRPEKLHNLLASIELQGVEMETTIAVDSMRRGLLGSLRNQAARASRGDILVVADDDIVFHADFCKQIHAYAGEWSVMLPRIETNDGGRYWDWRLWYGNNGQRMEDYTCPDAGNVIPCGALVIVRRKVWEAVNWSETSRFYDPVCPEDIDWGERLHKAGYTMTSNPLCIALHDDPRYKQYGASVLRTG